MRPFGQQPRKAPSYANTIEAMETGGYCVLDAWRVCFFNLAARGHARTAREDLQRDLSPKLSAYSSEIINNRALFDRIEALLGQRAIRWGLDPEQRPRADACIGACSCVQERRFRGGRQAARLTEVKSRLASLGTRNSPKTCWRMNAKLGHAGR